MDRKVEEKGKNSFQFTDTISSIELSKMLDIELAKNQSKFKIQGFRAGKVPMDVVKKNFGAGFLEEAANNLARQAFLKYIQDENIEVLGLPRIGVKSTLVIGADVEIFVDYELYPKIDLPDFSKLSIVSETSQVGTKEVDTAIENLRFKYATWAPSTMPAGEKDRVKVDFTGTIDSVEFDGGKAVDYVVELGMGKMLPDFEAGIIGMNKGEEKDISVSFPLEYGAAELAGKTAVFKIKLKELDVAELPSISDADFLKKVDATSELELKEKIEKNLKKDVDKMTEHMKQDKILSLLNQHIHVELPPQFIQDEAMRARESAVKQYSKQMKIDVNQVPLDLFINDVENRTKTSLIFKELLDKNNLEAKDEHIDAFLKEQHPDDYEKASDFYQKNREQRDRLLMSISEKNIFDYVLSKISVSLKDIPISELLSHRH